MIVFPWGATTTTTVPATTSTTGPDPHPFADMPLVVTSFGALGWWDGTAWVQVEPDTALPVSGGERYRTALLGSDPVDVIGGPPTILCEPVLNPGVELDDPAAMGEFPGPFGVAISASWDLVPHPVTVASDDGTYATEAAALLAAKGLVVDRAEIVQVLRFDLEGDGVDEVVVVAESIADPSLFAAEGDYSLAFLRRVVDGGDVATAILAESIVDAVSPGETPFVLSFRVGAIADLSGNGRMEIVLSSRYYEGVGVEVVEYVDDDLGPVTRIGAGCGA